jgi:tetratricopeptide (TPR) repeat protein
MNAHRLLLAALAAAQLTLGACSAPPGPAPEPPPPVPPAVAVPADSPDAIIRQLEAMAAKNPDDFVARNKLAGYYHQKLRETGNVDFLRLARRAADESLAIVPAEHNPGGLGALAQAEFSGHEFAAARDHARELARADPDKLGPLLLLADALLELGDYDAAIDAVKQLERRGATSPGGFIEVDTRLARVALLRGKPDEARRHFTDALTSARQLVPVPREIVAWCYWQLGETAFAAGDYVEAESRYREALTTFPDYYRGLAGLGRALAARGDTAGAIELYERVTKSLPDPTFVGVLGDLYAISGRDADAARQYDIVAKTGRLGEAAGVLYDRQLALFLADHGLEPDRALEIARREYEARRDVYGADVLAWAALKAGKVDEAKAAIADAMKLGTLDAKLFYHAGMIARAAGDAAAARRNLERALELSPEFDPLQAREARRALDELRSA